MNVHWIGRHTLQQQWLKTFYQDGNKLINEIPRLSKVWGANLKIINASRGV